MKYIELTIETTGSGIEPVIGKCASLGINNTEVSDPSDVEQIMEKRNTYEWDYIEDSVLDTMKESPRITIYFEDDKEGHKLSEDVITAMKDLKDDVAKGYYGSSADFGTLSCHKVVRDDADWKDKWKEYFKPFRVSNHILICPSWEVCNSDDDDMVITIDPGMAFGTGTHETTSMCIRMLDEYIEPGQKVLDAGCGSGILSIAAAMLGAEEVLGIDIDRKAVEVSIENIEKNEVDNIASAEYGDLTQGVDYRADLIVANLMAELLAMLSDDVYEHLSEDGVFISSGILTEKEDMVTEAFENSGFEIEDINRDGEWSCIAARKSLD